MRINPHHVFVLIHARTQTTTRPTPTTTTIFSPPHPTFGLWGTRVKFPEPTWLRGPIKTSKLIGSHLPPLVHEFWYPPPRSPRHVSSPASPFLFTLNKLLKYSLHNFFFKKKKIFFSLSLWASCCCCVREEEENSTLLKLRETYLPHRKSESQNFDFSLFLSILRLWISVFPGNKGFFGFFFSLHRWVLLLWARSIFVLQIFCLTFFFLHVWIVSFMIYILRLVAEKILETKRMLFFFLLI